MGTAAAEFKRAAALERQDDASSLRGDHRAVVDARQQEGLDELGFAEVGFDAQQRLVFKSDRALGHRPDVAAKTKIAQVLDEAGTHRLAQCRYFFERFDLRIGEAQFLQIAQAAFKASDDEETPVWWQSSHEELAGCLAM